MSRTRWCPMASLALVTALACSCQREVWENGQLLSEEESAPQEEQPRAELPHYRVAEARSGDTIVLEDGRVVQYAGVRAPQPGERWFEESRRANEAMVLGRRVLLQFGSPREIGGVLQAYIEVELTPDDIAAEDPSYAGDRSGYIPANWSMLRCGGGRLVEERVNRKLLDGFRFAESNARQQKIGIWQE